jgi:transposase
MPNLSLEQRFQIYLLGKQNKSISNISRIVKCSRKSVRKWKNQNPDPSLCVKTENRGRKRKATDDELQRIEDLLTSEKYKGSRQLLPIVKENTKLNISDRTLRRYASALDLMWGKFKRVQKLTPEAKLKRLKWCKKHLKTNWKKWIFSDEKIFRAGSAPLGVRYRKGCQPKYSVKPWSGQVFVWSAFTFNKMFEPQIIESRLNGDTYIELLKKGFVSDYESQFVYQQDNARPHVAKKVKLWMEENNINVCKDWPPYSPDINPIENLWGVIDYFVKQRRPKNEFQVKKFVLEEMRKIDTPILNKLINSMPSRISAVIKSKGGHSGY